MNTPKTIPDYLEALRRELQGADPALVQDALYDAEEYLRAALAEHSQHDEAEVLAGIASSYGAPAEVADIYRTTEAQVTRALRAPPPRPARSLMGRFFGVAIDPRTWGALFYMLLALATGLVYFMTVITGLMFSTFLSITIIGLPLILLFVGVVRVLSLLEGRIIEVLIGERMPRRPLYADRSLSVLARIQAMFTDPRTWTTMLYLGLMLPLGIIYFAVAVTGVSVSFGFVVGSIAQVLASMGLVTVQVDSDLVWLLPAWLSVPVQFVLGFLMLFVLLHVARAVGMLHAGLAKHLLVKSGG